MAQSFTQNMNDLEMGKHKFALIGTSCAGKSTLTYEIVAKLKRLGILVEGVFQQDRRLAFDRPKLETEPMAQYWVLFNQAAKECELLLRDGTDVLVSDRSVIDFYAYYETMYGRNEALFYWVKWWAESYDMLYLLQPLPYQDDGSRPSDVFRTRVNATLTDLAKEIVNITFVTNRDGVYKDILKRIERVLSKEELALFPEVLGTECLIGGSYAFNRATRHSDVDVYVSGDKCLDTIPEQEKKLRGVFGVNIQVRQVTPPIYEYMKNRQKFLVMK